MLATSLSNPRASLNHNYSSIQLRLQRPLRPSLVPHVGVSFRHKYQSLLASKTPVALHPNLVLQLWSLSLLDFLPAASLPETS